MSTENGLSGLGLDQLAKQVKGQKAFNVSNPKPSGEPQPPTAPVNNEPPAPKPTGNEEPPAPADSPKPEGGNNKNILNQPIEIPSGNNGNNEPSNNNDSGNPSPNNTNDASSPLIPFVDVLKERGILSEDTLKEADVKSADDLVNLLNKENSKRIEEIRSNFIEERSPEAKRFIEMLDAGIPLEQAQQVSNNAVTVKDFTEDKFTEDPKLQEKAVEMYLQNIGLPEDEIKDQLEYFKDTEKLYDKALNYGKELQKAQKAYEEKLLSDQKAYEEDMKKRQKEDLDKLKDTVHSTEEIIPGRKLSDEAREKLFKSITTAVDKDPNTGQPINAIMKKRMEDPLSFEIKLHYLNELGVFDDKWDGILSSGKSKAVEEFERALQSTAPPSGSAPIQSPEQKGDSKSVVDSFKTLKEQLQKSKFKTK